MPRRTLHYVPLTLQTPHFETDLDLMQQELERGTEVHVLTCNAALLSCETNPQRGLTGCAMCVARRLQGLALLQRGAGRLRSHAVMNLGPQDRARLAELRSFRSLEELRAFTFHGFDAGLAAMSTAVSLLRDPTPSVDEHAALIDDLVRSACGVFLATRRWIRALRPDEAFVFNARFSTNRAFLRACQAEGVRCSSHDSGASAQQFALFPDALPHDRALADDRIRAAWAAADLEQARAIGADFYRARARGVDPRSPFTAEQERDLLPRPWPAERLKVAVFLSSEDEFVALGPEWQSPLYGGQWEGLLRILEDLRDDDRLHVYVRCHPNSRATKGEGLARLMAFERSSRNTTVIPPDSPVSSYALLRGADRVLSFGSTVGIEATYWGRPSILVGVAWYRDLGGTYNPADHRQVLDLLRAVELPPKEPEPALMYGYFLRTFGTPFVHFEATGRYSGRFRGRELRAHQFVQRVATRLARSSVVGWLGGPIRRASRELAAARLGGRRG